MLTGIGWNSEPWLHSLRHDMIRGLTHVENNGFYQIPILIKTWGTTTKCSSLNCIVHHGVYILKLKCLYIAHHCILSIHLSYKTLGINKYDIQFHRILLSMLNCIFLTRGEIKLWIFTGQQTRSRTFIYEVISIWSGNFKKFKWRDLKIAYTF